MNMSDAGRSIVAGIGVVLATTILPGCAHGPDETPQSPSTPRSWTDPFPLAPYRAIVAGTAGFDQEQATIDEQEYQTIIGACMREQGFEYFPPRSTGEAPSLEEVNPPDPGPFILTRDFAERYGYGYIHQPPDDVAPLDEDAPPDSDEKGEISPEEEAYWDSLSQADIEAYDLAMRGNEADFWVTDAAGEETYQWDWTKAGCIGKASHEVFGDVQDVNENPAFQDLVSAINSARPDPGNDEMLAGLEGEWSACMDTSGYQFAVRRDAVEAVSGQIAELYTSSGGEAQEPSKEQLDAAFRDEVAVAVADVTCAEEVDYEQRLVDLTYAFEQRFVDEHRVELDAMALKYGG